MSSLLYRLLPKSQKKNSRWLLLFVVIFLVTLVPVFLYTLKNPNDARAGWFNDHYGYRQKFSFTHNAAISDNRAVTFTLDTAELITDGVMQADCDDTRFTDANGAELKFDLTGTCNNASTTYEVIFPSIINGTQYAYVYYGNTNAQNAEIDSTQYTALTPSGGDPGSITDRTSEETSPGPVSYWSFDEGIDNSCPGGSSDACDSSGNGNHGVFGASTAAPTWQSQDQCVSGKCLYFDGSDDYMQFSSSNTFSTSAGTVSMWVKANGSQATPSYIFSHPQIGDFSRVYLSFQDGGYTVDCIVGGISQVIGTYTLSDSQWTHLACTWDGTSTAFYVNGVDQTTLSSIVALSSIATDSYLGSWDGTQEYFNGSIDEARIYPYARTATEIKQDYNNSVGIVLGAQDQSFLSDGLVGYWPMDDGVSGNGQTILDSSGNGNSGTTNDGANDTGMDCTAVGKFGKSCNFDGADDYVNVGDVSELKIGTGDLTISAWFYPNTATAADFIVGQGNPYNVNGSGYDLEYRGDIANDPLDFRFNDGSATLQTLRYFAGDLSGAWHHIMVTLDHDGQAKMFLDGELVAEATNGRTGDTQGSVSFKIGTIASGTTGNPDGNIDEVRIYNRAFSPAEVKNLYNWAPGPVAYYDFDNQTITTSLTDKSDNNNSGSIGGSMTQADWTPGKYGKSLDFDGTDDNVQIDNAAALLNEKQGTISVWVYRDFTNDGTSRMITSLGVNSSNTISIDYDYWNANTFTFQYQADGNTNAVTASESLIPNQQWTHLAFTWDSVANQTKAYINGVLHGSDTSLAGTFTSSTFTGDIAAETQITAGINEPWQGKIDEFKVYDYARTQEQILADMRGDSSQVSGARLPEPLAHWSFDEMNGQTVSNSSSWSEAIVSLSGTLGASSASSTDDPTWTDAETCKTNACLNFDGGDYLEIPDTTLLSPGANNHSVAAWFKTSTDHSATGWIYSNYGSTTNNVVGIAMNSSEQITCLYRDSGNNAAQATTTSTWNDGNWHRTVCVRDGTTAKLYIDGKLVSSNTNASLATITTTGTDKSIGSYAVTPTSQYFTGLIDEVSVYNTALSPTQVAQDMSAGSAISFGSTGNSKKSLVTGTFTSPVGYWSFDEGSGLTTKDLSGNDNTGTFEDMTESAWTQGKIGKALNFTGNNENVTISDPAGGELDFGTGDMSVMTWMKTSNTDATYRWLIDKKFAGSNTAGYYLAVDSAQRLIYTMANGSAQQSAVDSSGTVLNNNKWHHVAAVLDRNGGDDYIYLYIDGRRVLASDTVNDGWNIDSTTSIDIGENNAGTGDWDGQIDEVKLFDYALSQAQIAYEYNQGKPIAHWQFDECQGTTAHDASGNGLNGTITPGAGTNTSVGTCNSGAGNEMWDNGSSGKINASLDFDGTDDYVNLGNPTRITQSTTKPFSVFAWVKSPSGASRREVVSFGGTGGTLGAYLFINTSNQVQADVSGTSGPTSTVSVADNTWHFVGVVNNSGTFQIYVDGKPSGTSSAMGTININGSNAYIGRSLTSNYYFDGQIDDVQIFNYPLSDDQVKQLHNGGAVSFR